MCWVRANQKFEMEFSTRPLSGMGSGSTTSKAESRSVVTISIDSASISYMSRTLPVWIFFRPRSAVVCTGGLVLSCSIVAMHLIKPSRA